MKRWDGNAHRGSSKRGQAGRRESEAELTNRGATECPKEKTSREESEGSSSGGSPYVVQAVGEAQILREVESL